MCDVIRLRGWRNCKFGRALKNGNLMRWQNELIYSAVFVIVK